MDKLYSGVYWIKTPELFLKVQLWQIVPCRIPKQNVWYWFLFSTKKFRSKLVGQLASDPNLLPSFWKAYCQNTAKSGQELCYRLFYGCSRRFYEIRQKEQNIERNLENNMIAIIFTGKGVLSLHPIMSTKPFLIAFTLIHKLQDIFTFVQVSAILCCFNPFRSNWG